ncbi:hypothetical protein PQX77_015735 [Marasmius sp. AFHP31]|nr:hypothetical protein PQX77_015735 [Marasmius sp. AFHP31]
MVSTVDFMQLMQPAIEREEVFWGEEGWEMGGESRKEEEGTWLAGDWTEYHTPGSSSSKLKLEDVPACSSPNKQKFTFEEEPPCTLSLGNTQWAKRQWRDFKGPKAHVLFDPPLVSEPIATAFASEALLSTTDTYTAKNIVYRGEFKESAKVYTLQELENLNHRNIEWDGKYILFVTGA